VAFALSNIKRQKEGKESFDEGVSVNIFISKNCWNKYFWPGICYLLNLLNVC